MIKSENLLWSGGWDSTFILLNLLLIQKKPVQPYYLIDKTRPAAQIEIETMKKISKTITKIYPFTNKLLFPVKIYQVSKLLPDEFISKAYELERKKYHLGSQHEWLARFAKQMNIHDLQIGVFKTGLLDKMLRPYMKNGRVTRKDMNKYLLFKDLSFPIFKYKKKQMFEFVTSQDWLKIMKMTWFCHRVEPDQKPCGKCYPCLYAVRDGIGWRLPFWKSFKLFLYLKIAVPLKIPFNLLFRSNYRRFFRI